MDEILTRAMAYLRGAWRFRWHALTVAWVVAIGGWLGVYVLPDIYQARARVYVDTESVLKPLLSGLAVNTDIGSQVHMMSTVLFSRPNLENVARKTDLYLRTETPEQFENLVSSLPKRINLVGGGPDSTYTLTYTDSDRAMAQRVVQTLLTTFVEDTLGLKSADSGSAQRFLEQQISELEVRLKESESRLAAFKQSNVGLMPGQTGDYYDRLQTSLTNLEQVRAKLRLAVERRNELVRQLEGEEPTFGLVPGAGKGPSVYDARIAEHKKRLDQLLLQYTEKHPEVVALRETIAQLEEKKRNAEPGDEAAPLPTDPGLGAALRLLNQNPVYQQKRMALSQAEVDVVGLRGEVAEEERKVRELRGRVDTIPEVEAQLAQLNRDYDVIKKQHTELVQRLESARLSENAQRDTKDVKFRVIEPPSVPLQPVGPDRPLLLSAVLVFAIAAGLALAVILDQLRPVFSSRSVLSSVTGRPVLGSVRRLAIGDLPARERRQNWLLASAAALLLLAYAGAIAWVTLAGPAARDLVS